MKELIAIIPVYNEEEIIEKVINDWVAVFDSLIIDYEIHIYNDGSKDKTPEILDKIKQSQSRVIVHHKINSGHGPTLTQAYKENADKAKWLFQTDSDDEISPDNFSKLWEKRDAADILLGKRFSENKAASRIILTAGAKSLVKLFFGQGIDDTNSPFRLFKSDKLNNFIISLPENSIVTNVLMSCYVCSKKYKVIQIPVKYTLRKTGVCSIQGIKLLKLAYKAAIEVLDYRLKGLV